MKKFIFELQWLIEDLSDENINPKIKKLILKKIEKIYEEVESSRRSFKAMHPNDQSKSYFGDYGYEKPKKKVKIN